MYHPLPTRGVTIHQFESRHRAKWSWYGRRENDWVLYIDRMLKLPPPHMSTPAAPEKQYENYWLNWIFFFKRACRLYVIFRLRSCGTHAPPVLHSSMNTNNKTVFVLISHKCNTKYNQATQISRGKIPSQHKEHGVFQQNIFSFPILALFSSHTVLKFYF